MTKYIFGSLFGIFISLATKAQEVVQDTNKNELTIHMGLAHLDGIFIKSETGYNFNIEYGRQLAKPIYLTFGYGYVTHNNFPKEFNSGNVLLDGVPVEIDKRIRGTNGWNFVGNDWSSNNYLHFSSSLRLFLFKILNLRFGIQGGWLYQHKSSSSFRLTQLTIDGQTDLISEYTPRFVIDNENYFGWMVGAQVERVIMNKWYLDGEFRILLGFIQERPTQTTSDYSIMRLGLKRKF
jgi:hypothetical protein